MNRYSLMFLLACFSCILAIGYAADKKITKKQIPSAVLKAFESAYPNAKIKGQAIENEKGKKFYEIESIDGNLGRDLLYTPEGKVHEIEETVDPGTLPDIIKSTLTKECPKGKIEKAEKVTTDDTLMTYEIKVKVGKKSKSVTFNASGKLLKPAKKIGEKEKDEEKED
jgi:Putative beta-lactamase-inhibitor-like, PepSY-like